MRALVMRGERDMRVEELDVPEPGPNDVRVRMVASGVCHTDATVLNGGMPVPTPIVLGHEGAGIVDKVGRNVGDVLAGDTVEVDADLKKGEMKLERETAKRALAS